MGNRYVKGWLFWLTACCTKWKWVLVIIHNYKSSLLEGSAKQKHTLWLVLSKKKSLISLMKDKMQIIKSNMSAYLFGKKETKNHNWFITLKPIILLLRNTFQQTKAQKKCIRQWDLIFHFFLQMGFNVILWFAIIAFFKMWKL